jgi:putative ATP-dependent endonuclease of OLD family
MGAIKMKLKKICIENYRTISEKIELSLENTDILFLFGKNNVGKSTVLKALEKLCSAAPDAKDEDFNTKKDEIIIQGVFNDIPTGVASHWIQDDELTFKAVADSQGKFQFSTFNTDENDWGSKTPFGKQSFFVPYLPSVLIIPAQGSVDTFEANINDFCKKIIQEKIKDCSKYKDLKSNIQELQNEYFSDEKLDNINLEVNKTISELFPSISFKIESQNQDDIKLNSIFEKNIQIKAEDNKADIKLRNLGDGLMRLAALNYIIELKKSIGIDTDKQFIICIEEPELYLHPYMIRKFRDLLYKLTESGFQVICTSHNPQLVDLNKPHTSIATLKKENFITKLYQVESNLFNDDTSESIRQAFKTQMYFDPNVCEVFLADEVILVESYTEPVVLRYLLNEKINYLNKELFVVGTSPNNFVKFIEVFNHFNLKYHVIHDIDKDKHGTKTRNENIKSAIDPDLGRLYLFDNDFETAHSYKYFGTDGKPLSALTYFQNLSQEQLEVTPIFIYLKAIIEDTHQADWAESGLKINTRVEALASS